MPFASRKPSALGTKALYPGFIEPALATSIEKVPSGERWIHEIMLATHFSPSNADCLVQLLRHIEQSHRLAMLVERAASSKGKFTVDDYISLLRAQNAETATIRRLATSLRLTQQAVFRADRADNRPIPAGPAPWEPDPEDEEAS
jgi:hypothetical protein